MPKIVSRSAISESSNVFQPSTALRVYYCICGEFVLVIDKTLNSLPRRKTDDSIIIRCQESQNAEAQVFKVNAELEDPVLVERTTGSHERQYRLRCTRCQLLIGYKSTPGPIKSSPFLYILKGALSQIQGQVPDDAFDGEEDE